METLIVYALLTSSMFYLGSRAVITKPLWSRYPPKLASFMDCAACSGAWYGLLVGIVAWVFRYPGVRGYPGGLLDSAEWYSPVFVALCSIVWTPIVAGLMQAGFERLGSAIEPENDDV
jgi:hypothetical protein